MPALMHADDCLSELVFDHYFSGELSSSEARALHDHLTRCVRCSLRCDVLARQREAYLERMPGWEALEQRGASAAPAAPRRRKPQLWAAASALALAAAVMLVALPRELPEQVRSKGKPQLSVFLKQAERVHRLSSGEHVAPGDRLGFAYTALEPKHFALLQRDARGAAIYYPVAAETVRVAAGHDVALDFSIQLDDASGDEHFYALFCTQPAALQPLVEALLRRGQLTVPSDCQVDELTLKKRSEAP